LRLVIILLCALSIQLLHAQAQKPPSISLVEQWRPTITKILGEEFTKKLIGPPPVIIKPEDAIVLPKIPVIKVDVKSAEIYNKKPEKIILKKEEEENFHFTFVTELFEATRMVKPTEEEFNQMMTVLSQGGSREGVYHSLVLDSKYAQLESIDKPVKDPAANFALYFYDTYAGKKIAVENLKKMNMFSLKRVVAEKAIDIIDAYGDNREDIEKWYAVLSADLATRFPQVWTNALRKNTSKLAHKKWASKAPIQHIKSSVYLKLHAALNSLM